MPVFKAENAVLHGAGREDIDAVMIGSGRPFILEIVHPLIREADLSNLTEIINKANRR